ncbi:hypothetical protein ACHAXR_000503, partial [Thalassiosira sp. AJA248-18]
MQSIHQSCDDRNQLKLGIDEIRRKPQEKESMKYDGNNKRRRGLTQNCQGATVDPETMSVETKATVLETIVFDVGGKTFKVSRSLIEQYDETMLGRLVSKTWQGDPNEPVFIDRNGDLFAHVLDYLRYGCIDLPLSTPRSNFIRELDFYGIYCDATDIKQDSPAAKLEDLKKIVEDAELHHDMFLIAVHVYHQFMKGGKTFVLRDEDKESIGLKRKPSDYHDKDFIPSRWALESYLEDYYGLQMNFYGLITPGESRVTVSKLGSKEEETEAKK